MGKVFCRNSLGYRCFEGIAYGRFVLYMYLQCLSIMFLICCREQAGRPSCPLDPYFIVPDKCRCVDFQVLKLQESPDAVPNGEMPRHLTLYVDR